MRLRSRHWREALKGIEVKAATTRSMAAGEVGEEAGSAEVEKITEEEEGVAVGTNNLEEVEDTIEDAVKEVADEILFN